LSCDGLAHERARPIQPGECPHTQDRPDAWLRTSPVKTCPPNRYGLCDIASNVWEWTDDVYPVPGGEPPASGGADVAQVRTWAAFDVHISGVVAATLDRDSGELSCGGRRAQR
jgi:formylglycine-generating enzyme required for sulfatase activity